MENVLSIDQLAEALTAELKSISWIKEIKSHESIRLKTDESNDKKSVVDGISIEVYGDKSGYLTSLLIENSQSDGACSVTAYELNLEEEVEFKSIEEVKTYFAKVLLPKLLHHYFAETSEVIIRSAADVIKESGARINWENNYMYSGDMETGSVFKVGGNSFMFLYPMDKETGMPVFTFICNGYAKSFTVLELSEHFDEISNVVHEEVDDLIQDYI